MDRRWRLLAAFGLTSLLSACAAPAIQTTAVTAVPANDAPAVLQRIRVGSNPIGVEITPDGRFIYTANSTDNSISKVAADSMAVVSTISLASSPRWLAIAPSQGLVLITSPDAHSLTLLDIQGNYLVATIDLPYTPDQVVVQDQKHLAYISNSTASYITVVDLVKRQVAQNIAVTGESVALCLTPDGNYLYASVRSDRYNLLVIATADQSVVSRANAGADPSSIAMDPAGKYAYVANHGTNDVTMLYVPEHHAVQNFPVGQGPIDLEVAPSGRYLWVTCQLDHHVAVVDTATQQVVSRLQLDVSPYRIVFAPGGKTAYVANYELRGDVHAADASQPNLTLGSQAAQRVNNNSLLVISTGQYY